MRHTRTIAGHDLTLTVDARYRASRPFATRGRRIYPVSIKCIEPACSYDDDVTINGLNYEQANALVNEFNNGPMSFDGRIW